MATKSTETTSYPTLSTSQIDKAINKIQKAVANIEASASKGYISILPDVCKLNDYKSYVEKGYGNMREMAEELFGMSKSTLYNLLSIGKRYCDDSYKLLEEYESWSMRDLIQNLVEEKAEKKAAIADKKNSNVGKEEKEEFIKAELISLDSEKDEGAILALIHILNESGYDLNIDDIDAIAVTINYKKG